jgi:hypothetical protein
VGYGVGYGVAAVAVAEVESGQDGVDDVLHSAFGVVQLVGDFRGREPFGE